jgi:hypothetical protein
MDESSLVRGHSGRLSLNPGRRLWILADGSNRLPKLNTRVRFPSSAPQKSQIKAISAPKNLDLRFSLVAGLSLTV